MNFLYAASEKGNLWNNLWPSYATRYCIVGSLHEKHITFGKFMKISTFAFDGLSFPHLNDSCSEMDT